MDSHQPADPWGIPEGPADDAEGVVATAPKESPNGHADHSDDTDGPELGATVEVLEPAEVDPPADAVVDVVDDTMDHEPAVDAWEPEPAAEEVAGPEPVAETPAESPSDDGPRFDLGLDEDTSGNWGEPVGQFEAGTAFDLIPPSSEGEEVPQYEVDEPDLSDAFVAASPEGRPDVGTPHLSDPDPLMAVPEETHPELSADEPTPEPSSSFRLPGIFGRKKVADETPLDELPDEVAASDDTPAAEAPVEEPVEDAPVEVVAADEPTDPTAAESDETDEPPMPSAWGSSPDEVTEPADPFSDDGWSGPDVDVPDETEDTPPSEPVDIDEPVVLEAGSASDEDETDDDPEDLVADLENVLELPVAGASQNDASEGDDTMEIELTEPDLSEVIDAEQLYVTEDTQEDRPPALLTVDSVPGATIAQAVDVVTAVASAGTETEIADAMDRVLGQLRDKAHEIGGEAVISVHTEVQEMGGGFLVTGSGTAVTLA